jgi:hypothetical protein
MSEFFEQIFRKYSNVKFHKNLPLKAESFHEDRQMDGET